MLNQEIAKIFHEIAQYLEMQEVAFKPQAYEKAALNLEILSEDVGKIYKEEGIEGLKKIPGVGENIANKIVEFIKTGKIKDYQILKKKMPVNIEELTAVEGVGPKMVRDLYKCLKIKNLKDLEKAAKAGKIKGLPNFGLKTEQNILEGIKFLKRSKGRFLLGDILPIVKEIEDELKSLKEVKKISVAGSVRRMKETIGDVDFLAVANESKKSTFAKASVDKIADFFVSLPGVVKIWGKGATKVSVRMKEGFDVDLRIVPEKSYGAALQYFTGSKEHNIVLRKIAIDKGLKLNEYGLFRGPKMLPAETEEKIYKTLGLSYIEPEMRENQGEIEAALSGNLSKIINYKDIRGDLHTQTNWNGGRHSIEEMVEEAKKMGYEYLGISDHTKFLRIEHGLDERQLLQQRREIDKLNKKLQASGLGFHVLHGCESNIMPDGSIDINDKVLVQLDYVIAGVHSQMKMPKEKMTERIIKAMRNPNVDIISHPTGRILKRRDEYQIDFEKILKTAKETGTILEINSFPDRLDLNDKNIRRAKEVGVKMVINTDAHQNEHLGFMYLGISQARRGWAEKKDIINAWPIEKLRGFFKK